MKSLPFIQPIVAVVVFLSLHDEAHAVLILAGVVPGNNGNVSSSYVILHSDLSPNPTPINQTVNWPTPTGETHVSDQTYTNGADTMVAGYAASAGSVGGSGHIRLLRQRSE
jgi:hypothetical protein